MEISLIIRTSPEDAHRLTSVRCFIQTAIEQGHTIRQCFFQSAGVMAATQPEQLSEWQQIANVTHAELLLCSQAAEEHHGTWKGRQSVTRYFQQAGIHDQKRVIGTHQGQAVG